VEVVLNYFATGVMAANPRPDCYTAVATTGQTTVAADFSWTYNAFPSKGIGAVRVYLHGTLQTRGVDYTEVNLGTSMTNQVTFVDPLLGGENIIILPTNQVIDDAGASTQFNNTRVTGLQNLLSVGAQSFVDQSTDMIAVPNTTIVGRAKIPNLANDLRVSGGNERIMTQAIVQLQNEFGPNGEPVWAAVNDDRGLIRFVGSWTEAITANGPVHYTQVVGAYVEITFYGTGINLLGVPHVTTHVTQCYVDGVLTASNIFSAAAYSSILLSRGSNANIIVPAASGLSLGVHTVRLVQNDGTANLYVLGFEILNSNASGLLNINTGTAYIGGSKVAKSSASSIAYNTGVTGTKGGRIVRYLNSDGTVGQAFQAVDAAPAYLGSANHQNEEVVRPYNWREFGAGRTTNDDFSLLSSANSGARAFTLDDGVTTLAHTAATISPLGDFVRISSTNSLFFTFVGTGLDVVRQDDAAGGADQYYAYIDGGSGQAFSTTGSTTVRTQKIVSGLPYGTHTVKIQCPVGPATWNFTIKQFIVYQPKKPTIPATALELCDYNVMGDYVAATSGVAGFVGTGVLRKNNTRENVYVGTWLGPTLDVPNQDSGFWVRTLVATSYGQYTFFGTGIVLSGCCAGGVAANSSITIDGVSNLSGYTTSLVQSSTGITWTASTGAIGGTSAVTGYFRVSISGLPLGVHTFKVVQNTTTDTCYIGALDIITPIHSTKSNLYADLQNTLPVGSCSLMDSRKTSMIKESLPAQKAWAQAVGIATTATISVINTFVPMPDMSTTIKTSGSPVYISFFVNTQSLGGTMDLYFAIFVDGIQKAPVSNQYLENGTYVDHGTSSGSMIVPLSSGVHKVDLYWKAPSTNGQVMGSDRILTVQEI
jgi:hypothetical protein